MNETTSTKPRRRTQAERSAATRTRILDVTLDCLMDIGLRDTSTVEIARRAGVSRGALLHHYPSKVLLLQEAFRHLLDREIAEIQLMASDLAEAEITLEDFLDTLWGHFSGRLFMITIEYLAAARTDEAIRETMTAVALEFNDSLDVIWDSLPLKQGVSLEERRLALNATLCFLRGMGTQTVWRDDPALHRQMLEFWKRTLAAIDIMNDSTSAGDPAPPHQEKDPRG
ncbi:HTH-type transcriptional regulator BetI [wastewater metagenome]|uniref:HTH-type transcriptional regulator BetI n=2 Tax=unclassified sequences TaxID=12908 RepID=A0A5B8REV8_9ZZZZ|nr:MULTISPECIES: TetR/AcrR family transcriptional regulator [Arhodomonas]MCS4503063.1 TetR/AcrR family transcriptional regulator [Arhodomonas aquaeolei]QEA06052.1 HTH-type transcriptional regulator BetI [uncultured organism]